MVILEGALSVKAALESQKRSIESVWIDAAKESRDITYIEGLCKKTKTRLYKVEAEKIMAKASGKTHGGILAVCESRKLLSIQDLMGAKPGWIVLIEGVEDPFNLGQMIRTAYAAGAKGLILSARDWSMAESTLMKSSAGTFDRMDIATSLDLVSDLKALKEQHYKLVIGYRDEASVDYLKMIYPPKLVLAIGGEIRGLSRPVIDAADAKVVIRYPGETKVALNAVSACAVLCFEVVRQRQV